MSKKTSTSKTKKPKKVKTNKNNPNTAAIVGASLAAVAAGAYYSYSKGSWPFGKKATQKNKGGHTGNGKSAADNVDVALTNEVAESTLHNPNNASDFTDDGATGNAD